MSDVGESIEFAQYFHLILNIVKHEYTLCFPVRIHVNMSVHYIINPVSNWCHGKLWDFSEKTVAPQ